VAAPSQENSTLQTVGMSPIPCRALRGQGERSLSSTRRFDGLQGYRQGKNIEKKIRRPPLIARRRTNLPRLQAPNNEPHQRCPA